MRAPGALRRSCPRPPRADGAAPRVQSKPDVYLVGTEEGTIAKCSKAYSSEFLAQFAGHDMAVYAVKWNRLHGDVFLSASADWTVKLWHAGRGDGAVMTFDMGTSVGDVAWAPYSATVFAVGTADGKVAVFDLAQQKHKPMCSQKVVRKARLTKVAFHPSHPVLLAGDDRGCVTSLKLSPNLRKRCAAEAGGTAAAAEHAKLDAVIAVALKSRAAGEGVAEA
jgi:dynein intermediate chain 1, axonemal